MEKGKLAIVITSIICAAICFCCCCCSATISADADTVGCMVTCEVPEKIGYIIPKTPGSGFYDLSIESVEYQIIERN